MFRYALLALALAFVAGCFPAPPKDDEEDVSGDSTSDVADTNADVDPSAPPRFLGSEPNRNEVAVPVTDRVEALFDRAIAQPAGDEVVVRSLLGGRVAGSYSDEDPTRAIFEPDEAFVAGDRLEVTVRRLIRAVGGAYLESSAVFQFWTRTAAGQGTLVADSPVTASEGRVVLAGLLDDDARPDLVIAGVPTQRVQILLGTATGFAPATTLTGVSSVLSAALADFNGDGELDLAIATEGNTLIFKGNGDGTFSPGATVPVSTGNLEIGAGDLDGDGDVDLVAVAADEARVAYNNGDGTFAAGPTTPGGSAPSGIALADFNGDGALDYAISSNECCSGSGTLHVALSSADGYEDKSYTIGEGAQAIVVFDFDLDESLDIAVSNAANTNVGILVNRGNGNFDPQETYASGTALVGLAAGDIDGDGDIDLIGAGVDGKGARLLDNAGNAIFSAPVEVATDVDARALTLVDVDRDGDLDVATVGGASAVVLRNTPAR